MSAHGSAVKVYVRIRPTACFAEELIECLPDEQTVNVWHRRNSRKSVVNNQVNSWSFHLNGVLHNTSQEEVYQSVAHSVVLGALEGFNGTVICFGQTGAGKTYTMTGATESYKERGIIPRALQEVFREVEERVGHTFSVHLSFLEIYNETLVDLLASMKGGSAGQGGALSVVEEPEGGVSVKGLSLHPVHNEAEALNLFFEGEMNRIFGEHALNKNSSRSHCIFTIHTESRSRTLSDAPYVTSKLNLVDLAGSERLKKTGSERQVQREAMYINRSLSFLEQAIIALSDRRREHVPFRQSKLTHALKDSLGGNCNTVLVANIYGEAAQIEETLSTLRFAARMKNVHTAPSVNEHIHPAIQIRRLQKEIQLLRQELSTHDTLAHCVGVAYENLSEAQVAEVKSQVQQYLAGTLDEIKIVSVRQIQEVFAQFKKAVQSDAHPLPLNDYQTATAKANNLRLCSAEETKSPSTWMPWGEQEYLVKEQLSQKYTLVEKCQKTRSSSGAKGHEPVGAVGEEVGGFGLGVAALSQKHIGDPSPHKSKGKKGKESSRKDGAGILGPAVGAAVTQTNTEALSSTCEPEGPEAPILLEESKKKIDTPPSKTEAFEAFKLEQGSEISRILKENKNVLQDRLDQLHKLAHAINTIKQDIDRISSELRMYREQRQTQGQFVTGEGEPVLEESELALLISLREMKDRYRQAYEELLNTKAEVRYCQQLVDKCRTRLITEFECWYSESFLLPDEVQSIFREGPIRPGLIPVAKALNLEVDEQQQRECLRMELLSESPSAIPFYNAQIRTVQRRFSRPVLLSPDSRRNMGARINKLKLPFV